MTPESPHEFLSTEELVSAVTQRFDELFWESNKEPGVVCVNAEFDQLIADKPITAVVTSPNADVFHALSKYHDADKGRTRIFRSMLFNSATTSVLEINDQEMSISAAVSVRNPQESLSLNLPIERHHDALGIVYHSLVQARFLTGSAESIAHKAIHTDSRFMRKILRKV